MRQLLKALKKEREYYDSYWEMIYLSDWFDPIYRLSRLPSRIYHTIEKFIYYGKVGTSCHDFDANSIHTLINAHIKRVERFMKSDNTTLVWNSDENTRQMKLLREFSELCTRMCDSMDMQDDYFFGKVLESHERPKLVQTENSKFYRRETTEAYRKASKIAIKKDDMRAKHLLDRYYYLLQHKVPGFWD